MRRKILIFQTVSKGKVAFSMVVRDCSEFLVRGGGPFAGGYPFLTRFPRGGMNVLLRFRGGYPFVTHTQKQEHGKMPLLHYSRCRGCLFRTICPCCSEKLVTPWGYLFLTDSEGGYQNFTETPRGGYGFLRALFPKNTTHPQQEILNSP